MEKIIAIKEYQSGEYYYKEGGYEIITDKQSIKLTMDDQQSCCENYGYFMSNDDTAEFIGAEVKDVYLTDTALNKIKVEELEKDEECSILFVNISTNRG